MSRGLWFALSVRTRRTLVLLWTALFLCSLALQSVQLAAPSSVFATPPGDGAFQLEGNATDGGAGDDWANVFNGSDSATTTYFVTDSTGLRYTTGSKDTLDFPSNGWDTQSVPDKDDILHAYAAFYPGGGDPTITFGLDRFANNGDANVGFWFFQGDVGLNDDGSFSGNRTVGDLFVVSEFDSGGDVSTIVVFEWDGSGLDEIASGADCVAGGAVQDVCALANAAPTAAPWSYTPKAGAAGTFPVASFFEGGLQLDEIFPDSIPCFSSFMAETRASTSDTAQLKNFVLGNFDTCGDLTIIKNTVPNGPQDFNYNSELGNDFQLDDDSNGTLSDTKVYSDVNPGTYTISEDQIAGWDLTDIDCDETVDENSDVDLAAGSVDIVIDPTESVTCTFTNTERGSITVRKLTSPAGSAGDFDFDWGGVPNPNVQLSHGETSTIDDLVPGEYTVTEAAPPAPFSLGDISCNDGGSSGNNDTRTATFDLDPGEDITCTFVNVLPGTITITKVADPEDGTDFDFLTTGGNGLDDFSLDVDNDGMLDDTETFTVPAGDYSVAEDLLPDWDLVDIDCVSSSGSSADTDLGDGTVDITLIDGGSVACTYVNVERGEIIVQKETTPDGDDTSFDFESDYGSDFSLSDGESNASGPLASNATYSVAEVDVPEGWELTSATCSDGSAPDAIELDPGETVTCTFNNLKLARIITVKQTEPDGADVDFTFNPSWSGSNFVLQDDGQNDSGYLDPGSYNVGELPTLGWQLISQVCESDLGQADQVAAAINLSAGETVTCTFVNRQLGEIIVEKQTLPDGDPQTFSFTGSWDLDDDQNGDTFSLGDGQQEATGLIPSGAYSVAETVPAGWDLTSAVCSDQSAPSAIDLDPGETVTCVFTNTKRGTIIVEKQTSPDGASGDFTFTGDAAGSISDGEQIVVDDLVPGTYSSTEGDPGEDWNLGTIGCDDDESATPSSGDVAQATATFELDPGETVTCVFVNVMDGSITIIKDADPEDGTDFDFTTTGGGLSDFMLDDDADGTLPNDQSFLSLAPGSGYSVAETSVTGWDLASIDCNVTGVGTSATPAGNGVDMTLADGGSITCTFVNEQPSIDIEKTAGNAADGDPYTSLAGDITYTYVVTNDGANRLVDIEIVDDNGTPADLTDDFGTADGTITCDVDPRELDPGASMTCSATVPVADSRINVAAANAASVYGTPVQDEDDAEVIIRKPAIDLDKDTVPGGVVIVGENAIVEFSLDVTVVDGPVYNAVISDVLPVGQTYVADSQSASIGGATFEQDGQELTWTFASLATGSLTISYEVTIAAEAAGASLTNTAEVCVDVVPEPGEGDPVLCDDDDYTVDVPDVELVKTAGDAADGEVYATAPGDVSYAYEVTNSGPVTLVDVTVTDDAGTPADVSDDFAATCPKTTLASGESMTCSASVDIQVETVNVAVARGLTVNGVTTEDSDDAAVAIPGLTIAKDNDAELEPLDLPDGTVVELPTANEGETVGYTLTWSLSTDTGVTDAIITDVLPAGVTYVADSASATDSSDQFTFQGYDDATRTLSWTAATVVPAVATSGTVTYQATVDEGAAELAQPLINIASIESDQTGPDEDDSPVFVPTTPAAVTSPPKTLPPTDTLATPQGQANPGFTLMLVLLALGAIVLAIGFVTPVPASVRERNRR